MSNNNNIVTEILNSYPDLVHILFGPNHPKITTETLGQMSKEEREKVVKSSYRRRAVYVHPDKCSDPRGPEAFNRLKRAQEILLDENLANIYLNGSGRSAQERLAATEGYEDMMKHTGGEMHFGYMLFGLFFFVVDSVTRFCFKLTYPAAFLSRRKRTDFSTTKENTSSNNGKPFDCLFEARNAYQKMFVNQEELDKIIFKRKQKKQQNPYGWMHDANNEELFGIFSIVKKIVRWDRLIRLVGLICIVVALVVGNSLHIASSGEVSGGNGCSIYHLATRSATCFDYETSDGSVLKKETGLRRIKLVLGKKSKDTIQTERNTFLDQLDTSNILTKNATKYQATSSEWRRIVQEQMKERSDTEQRQQKQENEDHQRDVETGAEELVTCQTSNKMQCTENLAKLAYNHYKRKQAINEAWRLRSEEN